MPAREDEFYVGYLPRSPRGIAKRTLRTVVLLFAVGIAAALILVSAQAPFDRGVFEFEVDKVFEGIVLERPYPVLLVPDGEAVDTDLVSHYLVAFGKRGASDLVAGRDGTAVRVTGWRIYNDSERMIQVHAVEALTGDAARRLERQRRAGEQRLGVHTLVGEIVDSKCHLGVMKPGRGKPHKACAIRCISGGVPPVLRVEDESGDVDYFLLVAADGRSVNQEVLELIAEPVEITGEVARAGDLLVLYADPATYRRL